MAQGRTYEHGKSPRREEMDKFTYEMQEANSLAKSIRDRLYHTGLGDEVGVRDLTEAERVELTQHIADIEARITIGERESLDLIAYSNPMKVERERLDLDIARAQAKVELRKLYEKEPGAEGKSFDELLAIATDVRKSALVKGEEGIESRDKLFDKMKAAKVAKAAATGVIGGLVIGTAVQEAAAFFDSSEIGFVKDLVKGHGAYHETGAARVTPAEWLHRMLTNQLSPGETASHAVSLGEHGQVQLPSSMQLAPSDHGYRLMEHSKVLLDGLNQHADGSFDTESIEELKEHGFLVTSSVQEITHTATAPGSPAEYLQEHENLTHHVK
jgi:hypothetical protein